MTATPSEQPQTSVDELVQRITLDYDSLSRQLKVIARYVEQHRDHVGLDGIQTVAQQCQVQPSAVVRFAKHFGYSGFSAMQAVFRAGLTQQLAPARSYQARIRGLIDEGGERLSAPDIAREFLSGSVAGMQTLGQQLDGPEFARAVDLLAESDALWITASRRSFPVAVYLDYALQHTDKRVGLFTALGSMHEGQLRSVRAGDVLVAISFAPYAAETLDVVEGAAARGARIIALTDSRMCPLARRAEAVLVVQDNVTLGFRALTSTMGLAQSLFIALAYRLELPYRSTTGPLQAATEARDAPTV